MKKNLIIVILILLLCSVYFTLYKKMNTEERELSLLRVRVEEIEETSKEHKDVILDGKDVILDGSQLLKHLPSPVPSGPGI